MNAKLPKDAFAFYCLLGEARSHDAVAKHFHVHKRTVTRTARREGWVKRLEDIEAETRKLTDAKLANDKHDQQMRHRKMLLAMGSRAAKAIQEFPLESGMDGIKAAETVIKLERLLAGESTERTENVEALIRSEYERWMVPVDEQDDDASDDDDADDESENGEVAA
jgi:hypothetical protein